MDLSGVFSMYRCKRFRDVCDQRGLPSAHYCLSTHLAVEYLHSVTRRLNRMAEVEVTENDTAQKRGVPAGLWVRCSGCQATIFRKEAEKRMNVCPECNHHWHIPARQRIAQMFDIGTFEEIDEHLATADPLQFNDRRPYPERIKADQIATGLKEAAVTGIGRVRARRIAFGVTDSNFIMGSMGSVVGEKLARITERARDERLPLVLVSASGGGARMHEGILSLMQMAKVSAALARFHRSGGLYISVMTLTEISSGHLF